MQGLAQTRFPTSIAVGAGDVAADERDLTLRSADAAPAWTPPGDVAADERDLTLRALHDPQAFALLYRHYLDPVCRYCYHRLGSREAAEDATSQVFAKALAALPTYRVSGSFRSWLFAIAHNVVVDAHRSRGPDASLEVALDLRDAAPSPEEAVVAADEARALRALLAELTPDQARVVELRLAGLSEVEIARVLGRRPGAVRAVQFRALIRLRALLGIVPEPKDTSNG